MPVRTGAKMTTTHYQSMDLILILYRSIQSLHWSKWHPVCTPLLGATQNGQFSKYLKENLVLPQIYKNIWKKKKETKRYGEKYFNNYITCSLNPTHVDGKGQPPWQGRGLGNIYKIRFQEHDKEHPAWKLRFHQWKATFWDVAEDMVEGSTNIIVIPCLFR